MPSIVIVALPFVAEKTNSLLSTSLADNSKTREESSSIAWSAIEAIIGASLTGLTVKVKAPALLLWPSLTVIVTSISPL